MSTTNDTGNSGGKTRAILIAIIVLLALSNGYLIFDHMKQSKQEVVMVQQADTLKLQLATVGDQLKAKIQEYEQMKGLNTTLDSTIKGDEEKLKAKEAEISRMIKQKNLSASEVKAAKSKIDELMAEIASSSKRIDSLTTALKFMGQINDSLNVTLKTKTAEGEQLKGEKKVLSDKVAIASLLKPGSITITGVSYSKKGKESEEKKAKKSEKLKLSFDIPENKVAEPGEKTILVQIINPQGATIAVESEGSGLFVVAGSGEQKQYTLKAPFSYDGKVKHMTAYWKQTNPFVPGNYKAIFYQDGNELTSAEFTLK